jgi:hypothetical protein
MFGFQLIHHFAAMISCLLVSETRKGLTSIPFTPFVLGLLFRIQSRISKQRVFHSGSLGR